MNPKSSLQASLLLAFVACLAVVFVVQLLARQFVELPQLYHQEHMNDVHAASQVERAFALELARKQEIAWDNAHWSEAAEFLNLAPSDEAYAEFVESEYGFQETMHVVPRVSGYAYYSLDGRIHFESTYNLDSGGDGQALGVPLSSLPALPTGDHGASIGGFIASPSGPLQFVVTGITDDDAALPPVGYLVVWRRVDAGYVEEVSASLKVDLRLSAPDDADISELQQSVGGVLARDEAGDIRWLIDDVFGEPLMLVTQATPARTFRDGPLAPSSILGFLASTLVLILLAIWVARYVIRPIARAGSLAESIAESKDFTQRLALQRDDEIGAVARGFDHLLERVEAQEVALRAQNANLEQLAERDSLTGVYNRRVFDRVLERDWSAATRSARRLTCIMLDVDCFKAYNDHYGHPAGDVVLQTVATLLAESTQRATDCLCRYGGEEFIILLMDTEEADAFKIAQRMVRDVERLTIPHGYSECGSVVTVSAGVATTTPRPGQTPDKLIRMADDALYSAKQKGRNRAEASAYNLAMGA